MAELIAALALSLVANWFILVNEEIFSVIGKVFTEVDTPAVASVVQASPTVGSVAAGATTGAAGATATAAARFEMDSFCSLVADDISDKISLSLICIPVNFLSTFLSSSVFLEEADVESGLLLYNLVKIVKIKIVMIAIWTKMAIIRISEEISIPNNSINC